MKMTMSFKLQCDYITLPITPFKRHKSAHLLYYQSNVKMFALKIFAIKVEMFIPFIPYRFDKKVFLTEESFFMPPKRASNNGHRG